MSHRPVEVVPGIHMLRVPLVVPFMERDEASATLAYLAKLKDGWLMVDSGYNDQSAFDLLRSQLEALGIPLQDLRWLLITHYHPDHSGLAQRIKEASGARVIIHQDDWEILQHAVSQAQTWTLDGLVEWARSLGVPPSELDEFYRTGTFGRMLFPRGLEPDLILQGDENVIPGEDHLRMILTPGHSPGHVCLYDESRKMLFSGDHVLVEITPHISPSHLTSYNQLGQYLDALRKVRPLDVQMVLPAHERPFTHLAQRVDEILEHHRQRLAEVIAGLSSGPSTPWALASSVHWDVGPWEDMVATNRLLAVRETLAHLQFLESNGQVVSEEQDQVRLYRLNPSPARGGCSNT